MGGIGSSRWSEHRKRQQVERCWALDVKDIEPGLIPGCARAGFVKWLDPTTDEELAAVDFRLTAVTGGIRTLTLQGASDDTYSGISQLIHLQTTRPNFGGVRWWFTCPLERNGRPCNRRSGKLYLPPRADLFGCRICYDLTYRSVQTHDKRVDFYMKHPEILLAHGERGKMNTAIMNAALRLTQKWSCDRQLL
jgi:hypothetical protein